MNQKLELHISWQLWAFSTIKLQLQLPSVLSDLKLVALKIFCLLVYLNYMLNEIMKMLFLPPFLLFFIL